MRLIDADILEKEGWSLCRTYQKDKETMVHEVKAISEINTALSSAQSRNGEWMDYSDEGYVECPFCHSATNCEGNKDELHYCFSCGAELR